MGEKTGIAWTNHTLNLWMGCLKVSPGCANCYAATLTKNRMGLDLWGPAATTSRKRTAPSTWRNAIKWNREAEKAGVPARVFCGSLMDWAEDNPSLDPWRTDMWDLIRQTPWLQWQLLTKRADRIARLLPPDWGSGWPHVWLGVSVEDQEWADKRIPHLLDVPAAVRFLSYEPALGPLDLREYLRPGMVRGLHWVIQGGESGPNFRPMDHAWARAVRDQCRAAGCAYFFKQSSAYRTGTGEELDGQIVQGYPTISA